MYKLLVEKISSIRNIKKTLPRKHGIADWLLPRFENLPFDQEAILALEDYSEEPDYSLSRYFLLVPNYRTLCGAFSFAKNGSSLNIGQAIEASFLAAMKVVKHHDLQC